MTRREFELLKILAESKRTEAISRAQHEYQCSIEAIDRVWRMYAELPPEPDVRSREPRRHGELMELVKGAIELMPDIFTAQQVVNHLLIRADVANGDVNANAVSVALRRLESYGELELVEAGSGKRPSTYRRIKVNGYARPPLGT